MYCKLKGLMVENNITQVNMARTLNLSISALNQKINGKSDFTITEAKQISKILKKEFNEIFL